MNLAASCHLLNRPPLNRPPHVDIRKKSTPEPRVAVAGKNVKYHICISYLLGVAAMACQFSGIINSTLTNTH